ncbi:unnamed protein product [Linum trigynum]|uniref:Secreted protein n=1 Tax=Linum trigynum TaxID=586398 RepID=A0AAV2EQ49_9ROSI
MALLNCTAPLASFATATLLLLLAPFPFLGPVVAVAAAEARNVGDSLLLETTEERAGVRTNTSPTRGPPEVVF